MGTANERTLWGCKWTDIEFVQTSRPFVEWSNEMRIGFPSSYKIEDFSFRLKIPSWKTRYMQQGRIFEEWIQNGCDHGLVFRKDSTFTKWHDFDKKIGEALADQWVRYVLGDKFFFSDGFGFAERKWRDSLLEAFEVEI